MKNNDLFHKKKIYYYYLRSILVKLVVGANLQQLFKNVLFEFLFFISI